jgi:hypothetical protein
MCLAPQFELQAKTAMTGSAEWHIRSAWQLFAQAFADIVTWVLRLLHQLRGLGMGRILSLDIKFRGTEICKMSTLQSVSLTETY